MRNSEEHDNQVAVIKWCKVHEAEYPRLGMIFAVGNARKCTPRQGAWLKAEGVKSGVSDLYLSSPNEKHHGMYIEMKSQGGKLTESQIDWLCKADKYGYYTATCYSWITAVNAIVDYLGMPGGMKA